MSGDDLRARPTLRVWDPLVRVAHWALVTSVVLAWLTRHSGGSWHERIGYVVLGVVAVRLVWGWIGPQHARFTEFVRGPRTTIAYVRDMLRGQEGRHLGHNPLGAWMIVALLATVSVVAGSGWLYTTDRYWGVEWVETVHSTSTDVLIALVAVHISGVLFASYRHRENLIAAMFNGRKRG